MSKLDWVKWEAGKFLGGVVGMSIEEIGVYSVVLNLIYDNGGPIKDDRGRIARRCAMRPTSFEKVFQSLLEAGKLVAQDGLIMNEKAVEVLESRSKVVENWKKNLQSAKSKVEEIFNDVNGDTYASAAQGDQSKRAVESESVEKKERKKKTDSSSSRRAKTANGVDYSEEFELKVWGPYPRKKGTSKKVAYQFWNMLNEINQQRVISAIPIFADQMKREGRTEDKIKHLERFISQGVYETMVVTPAEASNVIQIPWHKRATKDQWERVFSRYAAESNWSREWGPAPGYAGCAAPPDLIEKLPYHLHPDNDLLLKSIRSKHAVDSAPPAVP